MDYECDECGNFFEVSDNTFIGQMNGEFECSPFMKLDKLCEGCYQKCQEDKSYIECTKSP